VAATCAITMATWPTTLHKPSRSLARRAEQVYAHLRVQCVNQGLNKAQRAGTGARSPGSRPALGEVTSFTVYKSRMNGNSILITPADIGDLLCDRNRSYTRTRRLRGSLEWVTCCQ
jgi:hypothetical protein